jgi:diguanylate cyclase (GGDEF)-like protein/PAS domain S-box-containing protein
LAQGVAEFSLDGTILGANENFLWVMGYRFAEIIHRHHRIFMPDTEADTPGYQDFWRRLAAGTPCSGEYHRITKDGRDIWLHATYNPVMDVNGRVVKVIKYATDVTDERTRQADFEGQIDAIHKSQDVMVLGLDGIILDVNARYLATLGYLRDELIGQHHTVLIDRDDSAGDDYAAFWRALRVGQHQTGLFRQHGKDHREVWVQASYNPILDLKGEPSKVVVYATDVSENIALAKAFEEAKREAQLDAATSLPSRAKFTHFLSLHLADNAAVMAVLYIDLDRFSATNEAYGYRIGDRVLAEVADRIRRCLRDDQMAARLGGDEFAIAAPGISPEGVERLCQILLEKLSVPILGNDDQEMLVSASIGVALAPLDGRAPDELLNAADVALAAAKRDGGACHRYFSNETNHRLAKQRRMMEDMRHSFTAGDFFIEYQPRFDAQTQRVKSFEALIRWMHPEHGRISPAEFIPLAERSGLIVPLGEWVLQRACLDAMTWDGVGVSVNLSPVQFGDDALLPKVRAALDRAGLAPNRLELEITEGVLLHDSDRAMQVLRDLKSIGIHLAIDDFGTGYSSLSYLRHFPFDVIKIDRSFVKDLDRDDSSQPVVQAIMALARALHLSVTAEGVETQAQLDILVADGCDEIQGFLLGKPSRDPISVLASSPAQCQTMPP